MSFKIVIVEPDQSVQQLLMDIFKEFELSFQNNAEQALSNLQQNIPYLILSEWDLPGMSGKDFCREVQTKFPAVPFIFLTENRETDVRLEAIHTGAIDFLTKPFDREYLLGKIKAVLKVLENCASKKPNQNIINHAAPALIAYMIQHSIKTITPVADVHSQFGFHYDVIADWSDQKLPATEQRNLLEDLLEKGWLERQIYDIVKLCNQCHSFNLTIREVCPHCHFPIITQDMPAIEYSVAYKKSQKTIHYCQHCKQKFEESLSFARCLSCNKDYAVEDTQAMIIYSYQLRDYKNESKKCWNEPSSRLIDKAQAHHITIYPSDLLQPFLVLEEKQHERNDQSFGLLTIKINSVSNNNGSGTNSYIDHIFIILKKILPEQCVIFVHPTEKLTIFSPYSNMEDIQHIKSRFCSFLDRLGLLSFVDVQVTAGDAIYKKQKISC